MIECDRFCTQAFTLSRIDNMITTAATYARRNAQVQPSKGKMTICCIVQLNSSKFIRIYHRQCIKGIFRIEAFCCSAPLQTLYLVGFPRQEVEAVAAEGP